MLENLMADLRRVYCLYRVSTLGQVEKDDIPMQKQYCREFVGQHPGWEIVKEFSEKGVSGFKVSAKDRDAIQEIQRDALQNKFDILLRRDLSRIISAKYNRFMEHITNKAFSVSFPFLHR